MKLYEITSEYEQILDNLYDEEGNIDQGQLVKLEENEVAMEKKAVAIASYIKNMDAERLAIEEAKKSMADREKRYKKKIDDLQAYLLTNMERRGINNIKCPYFEIKLKKCPLSVDDDNLDMDMLPDEYKRSKMVITPDKIKILQEMKVGVIIPGVNLKQNHKLEIR